MGPNGMPAPPGMELRHLRAFVAVAEERNFTRAAGRLHLSQQALSAQLRQLESALGATLLHRTTRRVEIAPAGEALLEGARELLAGADGVARAVREAAQGSRRQLVLGVLAGGAQDLLAPLLAAFGERHPDVLVRMAPARWEDPSAGLATGEADVAIIRPPVGVPGIEWLELAREPRVAAVPASHRLAGRSSIAIAEIIDEPWVHVAGTDPVWEAFWTADAHRSGPKRIGAVISALDGYFEAVNAGQAVGLVPESVAGFARGWAGISFVPVSDLSPSVMALAWTPGRGGALVDAFVGVARDLVVGSAARAA